MSDIFSQLKGLSDHFRDSKAKYFLLHDNIFLHGFGSPLSQEHQLRLSPEFVYYQNEIKGMDDFLMSAVKGIKKLSYPTTSLSKEWLRNGHNYSKNLWLSCYEELITKGVKQKDAIYVLTGLLNNIEVNRQSATITTKIDRTGVLDWGITELKIPLFSDSGGISGELSEKIESSFNNVRSQLVELSKQPRAELLFEKATKIDRGLHK